MNNERLPTCKLIGTDGNVFAIMASVSRTLRHAGNATAAREFQTRAMQCPNYGAVLRLCTEYVEVQ